ncbi:MAG: histidinol dehydrogenase [Prevotellaceae bacterium]|nr:histidinol dehydrogenase [Prevotellaceae bacterium]
MKTIKYPNIAGVEQLLARPAQNLDSLREPTLAVLRDVCSNGDDALRKYTLQFDRVDLADFKVSAAEFDAAEEMLCSDLKQAILLAAGNIRKFHSAQKEHAQKIETMPGVLCWRKSVGIERVGLYIPGGSAPLFSTVLMLGIPAKIAGCRQITLCTPPDKQGNIHPAILYAARQVGLTDLYRVGGIQAIGAMAFGTKSIPKVDKIFGPGNAYVTAAKQLVSNMGVAIDMPAGPSEVMVLADEIANPQFVAADLLSQAEHGPDSQVVLVTTHEPLISQVEQAIEEQLRALPRADLANKSLTDSQILLVKNDDEMLAVANIYAPEHLIISTENAEQMAEGVINAGSVFIGNYSPESAGDYASGTNHALPTAGYARSFSGVSVDSFVRKITFQKLSQEGIRNIGATVAQMADNEGLQAHRNAVTFRIK